MRRNNDDAASMVALALIFLGILALCAWNDSQPIHIAPKPARARRLLGRGLSHAEIAKSLGVSRRTVLRYLGE